MKVKYYFCLASLAFNLFLLACSDPASKLPDYGFVPPFTMTDSTGEPFDRAALAGKAWIADFIYTNCPAECPMMTSRMHSIEKQVRGNDEVRLVSFSVDPDRDTPAALTEFAHRFGGPTNHWIFLIGSPAVVHQLAYITFHVGDVIGKMNHSTKFILVDKRGHIRGYYSSLDPDSIPAIMKDLALLSKERS
ncbi:MAG: SCO family protein [Acidobacteriaceae bacterium]|nr:SCO family protein [Acidobacteriaceae bacterium]